MFDVAVWDIWSTLDIFCVLLDFDVGLDAKTRLKKKTQTISFCHLRKRICIASFYLGKERDAIL